MLTALLFLFLLPSTSLSQNLEGVFLDCGSTVVTTFDGLDWSPDHAYISTGSSRNVTRGEGVTPLVSTQRTFPLQNNVFRKFCYEIPVLRIYKHLVRTMYYYGGGNGNASPPVFDQIVDGTMWSVVNTTDDYSRGNVSYYEGVFLPTGKNLSVCVAANTYTDSDPFITALEVVPLWDQLYNSTNFSDVSFSLVARHSFGYGGQMIRYPEDRFNRYWMPFGESTSPPLTTENLAVDGIWNIPPSQVFQTRLETNVGEPLSFLWPPGSLPSTNYSISLYFAEDQPLATGSSRMVDISINGITYYPNLNVISSGVAVFANLWPLSGITNITLTSSNGSSLGPLVNGGEVFQVLPSGGKTLVRDLIAMISLRESFQNPPADWHGDPCLPRQFSWTGVTCTEAPRIRVATLNLTSLGLSGVISPSISSMTALSTILLGNNSLSGTIPDLSSLRGLEILHLEDNQLGGTIPPSFGNLTNLRELFLQNNNLTGYVPSDLLGRPGLTLRYTPGNPSLTAPPLS